jgi:hypothetical protein
VREDRKALMTRLDGVVARRFDGAFFTALGIVLMLRTLTYVDTIALVRVNLGIELNPLARLDTTFVAQWDILFAMLVVFVAILVKHRESRIVYYSFLVALVAADFTFDMAQFLEFPPINLAIAQVYALVWGITALIPVAVGIWQIEKLEARKVREERPLARGRLEDLELTV